MHLLVASCNDVKDKKAIINKLILNIIRPLQ